MSNNILIQDIHNAAEARAEAQRRYAQDSEFGFPGEPEELAEQGIRLASRILIALTDQEVDVYLTECGRELAIGEAHGAWGVWV